jgi:5'-nucleotidase
MVSSLFGGLMNYSLYLAHINDTHSHFEPSSLPMTLPIKLATSSHAPKVMLPCGGYAMIASALNTQRDIAKKEKIPSLFLHAGDSFQGSLYFSCFKGAANATLLNKLMPDAMTIGNHEFDLGNTPLSKFIAHAKFPLLAGNMDLQYEDVNKDYPLAVHDNLFHFDNAKNIAQYLLQPLGNKQLAIVGITLDLMEKIGCPDPDCHFLNAIETTRNTVEYLKNRGVDHIIILSHLGYNGDLELAKSVDSISLIVGGHSHTLTGDFSELNLSSTQLPQVVVNDTLIIQAGKHAESMGLSLITFNEHGSVIKQQGGVKFLITPDWHLHNDNQSLSLSDLAQCNEYFDCSELFEKVIACPDISLIINNNYRPQIESMRQKTITILSKDYHHVRLPNDNYPMGSQVAPFVSEAFYQCAKKHQPIDFALHNAGGVRVSLTKGALTQADICGRLLPFEIQIVSYRISGRNLKLALEGAINNATNNGVIGTGDGSYPYCFGLNFTYSKDHEIGHRIIALKILKNGQWFNIEDNHFYNGVSSAYTLAGKEGYDALLNSSHHRDLPYSMSDAFTRYLEVNTL